MPTDTQAVTLASITHDLRVWAGIIDSMDEGAPEREQALQAMSNAVIQSRDKAESFARFVARLDHEAEYLGSESMRLARLCDRVKALATQLRGYAVTAMSAADIRKLEGHTVTLALHANPPSVVIEDEAAVPSSYKTLTITVPAQEWEAFIERYNELRSMLDLGFASDFTYETTRILDVAKTTVKIDKREIAKDLKSGFVIPGADLKFGDDRLEIR